MSNIFHEIKRGFLILGFTGPLSSGCTTAAEFFEDEIGTYIKKRHKQALPRIENDIRNSYQKLKRLKSKLYDAESASKHKLFKEINKLSSILKEKLYLRETLSILDEYSDVKFKYISMTDMLLKLTIENLISLNQTQLLNEDISRLKDLINFDTTKLDKSIEISRQIRNRELTTLTKADIEIYEEFLGYIKSYKKLLKEQFADSLGSLLQDLGDNARRCGNPIDFTTNFKKEKARSLFVLAEEANDIIKFYRFKRRKEFDKKIYEEFVIEAFRNPYEVEYFRNRYYEFFLFSIYAPLEVRKNRENYDVERDKRDRGIGLKNNEFYKQNVSECVYLSDIAVNNDTTKSYVLHRKLAKYYALICRPGCIPPTDDELFMNQAYCLSVKSNCISRQVGAIIVGPRGYIIGAGWNDVGAGQVPCGLRRYGDITDKKSPFPLAVQSEEELFSNFLIKAGSQYSHHSFCFKDEYSQFKTTLKIQESIDDNKSLKNWIEENNITSDGIKDLYQLIVDNFTPKKLEYCRALHAEENAILQNSIIGGIGIEGATIYSTTFPCELCAKKIYQSRIRKVVYTEPYPESISEEIFFKDGSHSIELIQFEGIKSYSYYRLFKSPIDKKEFQILERMY